ncbi:orotidine-5'-phosphate decarboxylase [Tersicoccus sp. Bi-70]|uniref:orotidine-5'-phosphate decarboxylase n=1 Tax=Tersicoccus sp. Bi-70 TaxID=1897634 RepID=UPI0009789D11|nr:orotidine-5'-phosphate decarboxylase [Tersicoccus sp. Bi-70]OMH37235.1 orotidine 5'-phosphate decarboxylase [Tersicoccus sp. Bi-70]
MPGTGPVAAAVLGFGPRLQRAMALRGPLCVGIDPHPGLLSAWDLDDDAAGLERFSRTVLEAAAGRCAAIKPQVALFERHGSAGLAVLERLLAAAADADVLTIADAKRGDIGSTMAAYAQAWLADGSPLAADAVTLSPYLGFESMRPALDLAAVTGRGVFVLALTSNPEGAGVQHAGDDGDGGSVAARICVAAADENAARRSADGWGPVGLVVGATVGAEAIARLGIDLTAVAGPFLVPGYGAQGAGVAEVAATFGSAVPAALVSSSRQILAAGPDVTAVRAAVDRTAEDLRTLAGRP